MANKLFRRWAAIQERIPKPLRNKYVLVIVLFVVWMVPFDKNSLISQYKLQMTLQELKSKKAYYLKEIEQAERDKEDLFSDDRNLEKFAREHHLMKKDDEEIFIFVRQ